MCMLLSSSQNLFDSFTPHSPRKVLPSGILLGIGTGASGAETDRAINYTVNTTILSEVYEQRGRVYDRNWTSFTGIRDSSDIIPRQCS